MIKTSDICLGEGLSETVRNAVSNLRPPEERVNDLFCDINGERYRNEEWGFVCLRLSQYFDDPTAYRSPAECWGDMGAASGPLLAMLVCQAYVRGYSQGAARHVVGEFRRGPTGRCGVSGLEPNIEESK